MIAQDTYTIQELSEETGFPRRTIHFYTQQGILPPPHGAGLGATYNRGHLLRLKLIPILRNEGLRLDQIRETFKGMDFAQMKDRYEQAAQNQNVTVRAAQIAERPRRAAETYSHYVFPGGITIIAPQQLDDNKRSALERLLDEAKRLLES